MGQPLAGLEDRVGEGAPGALRQTLVGIEGGGKRRFQDLGVEDRDCYESHRSTA